MSWTVLFTIAFALAMDAFAVAIGTSLSLKTVSRRQTFRLAFHFALFQALMPILGWSVGRTLAAPLVKWGHTIAFVLLTLIALRAIWEGFSSPDETSIPRRDPTRGASLVGLSVATSIDAWAVRLSFAVLNINIWTPILIIGLVAGGMTHLGLILGSRLGRLFGSRMEILGGLVLLAVAIKILLQP
mgnify:FL=1